MANEGIRAALAAVLRDMGVEDADIPLERPRDPSHGDLATNVAMTLASRLRRPPREIAEEIADRLDTDAAGVRAVEVAGPGFLNFRLSSSRLAGRIPDILEADEGWGRSDAGEGRPLMVEFVSANPTGPLHIGHGRQAALGDAIGSLLEWTGWDVRREFYYNDGGRQMMQLARSVRARYRQHLGGDEPVPEDGYRGEYVLEVAERFAEEVGDRYLDDDSEEALDAMRRFASRVLRAEQDRDLDELRVHFDEHYLESAVYEDGRVQEVIDRLGEAGFTYESEGALWFRATEMGDQKDRVMVRGDGTPTYFLPDVAYHLTKWERGFHHAVNVQGADHHGTVVRVRGALRALGLPEGWPEYVLHQMVTVERGGEQVKFSKRAGEYLTLRELFEEVGVDVTRWFFQMRRPEAHLVFDLDHALDQSDKNPVYKVQYAHARMMSIFGKAGVAFEEITGGEAALERLSEPAERELVKQLAEFPEVVERAAEARSPHLLTDYLERTAGEVNSWYHAGNPSRNPELAVLVDDPELRRARLALAAAVRVTLRNGLRLLGITAPDRMKRQVDEAATSDESTATGETATTAPGTTATPPE